MQHVLLRVTAKRLAVVAFLIITGSGTGLESSATTTVD